MEKKKYQELVHNTELPDKKITVIVTLYNIEDYIERAIASVCAQTYRNLEILLVDSGSEDRSGEICDQWAEKDPRIQIIRRKENLGPSGARNLGIEAATGDYIAFVDGDDWIDAPMYEEMLRAMLACDADLAVCNYRVVRSDEVRDTSTDDVTILNHRELLEVFLQEDESYNIQNAVWNKLCKRELLSELRLPEGRIFEDIIYAVKLLALSQKCVYLNQARYNYFSNRSGSIMNSTRINRILQDQVRSYQEKGEFLLGLGEERLFRIHQYFFYKRMLIHYMDVRRQKPEDYPIYLKRIREIIGTPMWEVYEGQPKGDYVRMKLFDLSPELFVAFTEANEKYIIPWKQRRNQANSPLVVIRLSGGLGNQMFQYALYLQLKALGRNVKIDDRTEYEGRDNRRPIRLSVFGAAYPTPTEEEMIELTDSRMDLFSRIRRKLTGRKTAEYSEKSMRFDPKVLELERAYLTGVWQTEKYFEAIREQVKEAYRFRSLNLSGAMRQYEAQIRGSNAVAVHIRRGDYLAVPELYGEICTEEYYRNALEKMREAEPDCHFFIFTNDPDWAKKNHAGADRTIVEGNDEDSGYIDLYLMTQCRHFIIANSSFSWWGAYLGSHPDKKVIAPPEWFRGKDCGDIYSGLPLGTGKHSNGRKKKP